MNFLFEVFEVIALLVPDFLELGLVTGGFFSLYCVAKACGLGGTADLDSGFGIAIALAYFVTVAVNILNHLLTPTGSRIAATSGSESQSAQHACELSPKPREQSVEQGGILTAP